MALTYSSFKGKIINPEEIFKPDVCKGLSEYVYAHTSVSKNPETLIEHSDRSFEFFRKILNELSLESVINELLDSLYSELEINEKDFEKIRFKSFLWRIMANLIYYHDFGKINPRYQKDKLANNRKLPYLDKNFRDSEHSKYGMYFLSMLMVRELENLEKQEFPKNLDLFYKIFYISSILISVVDRHHSRLDDVIDLIETRSTALNEEDKHFVDMLNNITYINNKYCFKSDFDRTIDFINRQKDLKLSEETTLFFLYKILYSLLIAADYYATLSYKYNIPILEIKLNYVTEEIVTYLKKNFYNNKTYNQKLNSPDEVDRVRLLNMGDIKDLNDIRIKILVEASDNLIENLNKGDKRIFFLNVPTGGGKTNISMKLLIDILTHHNVKNIKRAYYVFPFINIIEQNYGALLETLTSSEDDEQEIVSKIYSYNEWDFSLKDEEELENYINQQFLNNPINVISNVNFFNTFIKNGKKINYKTINLVNSIFIIDEVQTLPNSMWAYFSKLINDIAKKYNCYFILMSATLPDISEFLSKKERKGIVNLINRPEQYQTHERFKRTVVELNFGKKNVENEDFVESYFVAKIKEEIVKSPNKQKVLCVVNTVKNSHILYTSLKKKMSNDFDIYLLNSTILSPRRREIIGIFNKKSEELARNILLVSTQSVEAGVDIDCNFGFREMAPLDSIEQINGRINREGKRKAEESILYVFDLDTAKYVYKGDYRLKIRNNDIELKSIIDNKRFNYFYTQVIDYLKSHEEEYATNYIDLLKPTFQLEFKKLAKRDYIKDDNVTFFLPLNLDVKRFPINNGVKEYLKKLGVDAEDKLDGEAIWKAYTKVLNGGISCKNVFIEAKKLQSVLNMFIFSLTNRNITKDTSLTEIVNEYITLGRYESVGGIVKVDKEFVGRTDYSIDCGLDLVKTQDFFKLSRDNII